MNISRQEYKRMWQQASPPTKSYQNIPIAFVVGGLICMLGEALKQMYR